MIGKTSDVLESLLCDPVGNICIQGSDADRALLQLALEDVKLMEKKLERTTDVLKNPKDIVQEACDLLNDCLEWNNGGERSYGAICEFINKYDRGINSTLNDIKIVEEL
jgi:hypothetical protein